MCGQGACELAERHLAPSRRKELPLLLTISVTGKRESHQILAVRYR